MGDYYSCAQTLPHLPPIEHGNEKYYRVTIFCKRHGYCSFGRGNNVPVITTGLEKCETCSMYTDSSKRVCVKADAFWTELYLDRLVDMAIPNLRKLFKLALSYDWENEQAVEELDACLDAAAADENKPRHERWVKIRNLWNDTKHKMNFKGA